MDDEVLENHQICMLDIGILYARIGAWNYNIYACSLFYHLANPLTYSVYGRGL